MATAPIPVTSSVAANSPVQFGAPGSGTGYTPQGSAVMQNTTLNGTSNQPTSSSGGVASPYAVVTSKPATDNYNGIQSFYNNTVQPAQQTATDTNAAKTAAANNLPVISGYNVSPTKTGNLGETEATQNGQTYYITPQKPAMNASDVQGMLSSPDTSTTSTPPSTPSQVASASMGGFSPTAETTSYTAQEQQLSDALVGSATAYQNAISTLSSGTIPLTTAQQSLVDATNNAFSQMTTQANLKAAALSSETGGVSDKVNAMGGQLIGIASDQAAAIAKMEVGFQKENYDEKYQTVTAAYQAYKDADTAKMEVLTKIHDAVMTQYQQAVQAAQTQQTFNQTVFKDTQTLEQSQYEFRDLKDALGTTIGTQVFDKSTGKTVGETVNSGQTNPSTGVTAPTVTTNPDGSVNKDSQMATLQSIVPKPYQDLVWSIVSGKFDAPNLKTAAGQRLGAWVTQVDPTLADGSGGFDATKYATRLTMQRGLASTGANTAGGAINSGNKFISHLATFLKATQPLGSLITTGNETVKGIAGGIQSALTGGENTSIKQAEGAAKTAQVGLSEELSKFFSGTGGATVSGIDAWSKQINPYASVGDKKGMAQGAISLFGGQFMTYANQYASTMGVSGSDAFSKLIQPEALATLSQFKNQGYDLGEMSKFVPYTDKNAYLSNGGSQDSLNSAYQTLKSNGIPTTPDNILHAAQL